MCASCGCRKVNDDHNDDRHLILRDLEQAAKAADIDVEQVIENLRDAVDSREAQRAAAARD
jgi:hypothetical protein